MTYTIYATDKSGKRTKLLTTPDPLLARDYWAGAEGYWAKVEVYDGDRAVDRDELGRPVRVLG